MLSQKQLGLIQVFVTNPFITNLKAAEIAGINNNTITQWKKNPEFMKALEAAYDEKWADGFQAAKTKMCELAADGDYRANEFLLKCGGINPANKVEATVEHTIINVSITDEDAAD